MTLLTCQAPLSMGFSRQEYWSGLPFPPSGDLPDSGIEPVSLGSPSSAGGFFSTGLPGKPSESPRAALIFPHSSLPLNDSLKKNHLARTTALSLEAFSFKDWMMALLDFQVPGLRAEPTLGLLAPLQV